MTTWTEANYLERLRVPLKDAHEASASTCPDAEMMSAYVTNSASEFVRNAVEEHLRSCADCRELAVQLTEFDAATDESQAMSAALQAEWVNAEKRLDIAAENFARTAEVDFKKAARVALAPAVAQEAAWQFPWAKTAWSVAAVAVLVVAGFLLMRKDGSPQTAHVAPATSTSAAVTAPSTAPATPATKVPAKAPPIAVANDTGLGEELTPTVRDANGARIEAEKSPARAVTSGAAKHTSTKHTQTENAPAVAANSATDTAASAPAPSVAANSPDTNPVSNAGAGSADTNSTNEVASNLAPTNAVPSPAAAAPAPDSTTSRSGTRSGLNSFGSHAASAAAKAPRSGAPSAPLPRSIQLSAGTRVWIVYKNVTHRSDESFAFTGALLEPISGTGTTPLAKDTEIDGEGVAVNGKTSLTVEQIVVRGVAYKLSGAGGAVTQGSAGGGETVTFNSGQVQELWLAGPATYEKAGDTGVGGSKP